MGGTGPGQRENLCTCDFVTARCDVPHGHDLESCYLLAVT
jgi:hypothetical protein